MARSADNEDLPRCEFRSYIGRWRRWFPNDFNLRMVLNSTNSGSYPGREETIRSMPVDGTIPEPATAVLALAGLAAGCMRRSRG